MFISFPTRRRTPPKRIMFISRFLYHVLVFDDGVYVVTKCDRKRVRQIPNYNTVNLFCSHFDWIHNIGSICRKYYSICTICRIRPKVPRIVSKVQKYRSNLMTIETDTWMCNMMICILGLMIIECEVRRHKHI